jgi:hypothetical protein
MDLYDFRKGQVTFDCFHISTSENEYKKPDREGGGNPVRLKELSTLLSHLNYIIDPVCNVMKTYEIMCKLL